MGRTVHFEWRNKPEYKYGYKFKSQIERKFADYLQILKDVGCIEWWIYEPETFDCGSKYRKDRVYTPDFKALDYEDGIIYYEVKTQVRQKDVSRFKWLLQAHPDIKIVLVVPSKPRKLNSKQALNIAKARKYVSNVMYVNPIFRKHGIT